MAKAGGPERAGGACQGSWAGGVLSGGAKGEERLW